MDLDCTLSTLLVMLQVDLVKKQGPSAQQQMVRVAEQLNGLHSFEQTFWVSALRDQGMAKLKDFLQERCAFLLEPQHTNSDIALQAVTVTVL